MADLNAAPAHAPSMPASVPKTVVENPVSSTQAVTVQLPKGDLNVRVTGAPTDYLTPAIQIIVAVFSVAASAGVILWQMRRQHDQAIEQHHLNVKADLRLDAYRDFQSCFRQFTDTGNPALDIASLRTAFSIAIDQLESNMQQYPPIWRAPVVMEKLNNHTGHAIDLIFFLERYESLLPGFDIFKTAISCALHDIRSATQPFHQMLIKWLPMEHPDYGRNPNAPQFINRPTITDIALKELNAVSESLEKALNQLQTWTIDLSVEAQNRLLGEYSDQRVKRREAPDQTFFTVTADAADRKRLDELFNATDYCRANALLMSETKARFANEAQLHPEAKEA